MTTATCTRWRTRAGGTSRSGCRARSWTRPPAASPSTLRPTGWPRSTVVLHGGEPLLAGPELIGHAATVIRGAMPPHARVELKIQTNAVTLDSAYLRMFSSLDIRVGVSLDGDQAGQDRHRRRRGGQGSHAEVSAALHRLASDEFRHLFSGLLCTIDTRNDPLATYQALLAYQPPAADFLLPHATWGSPPPGRGPGPAGTPYASWLITIFDHWYHSPRPRLNIRLFTEIIHLLLGGASETEVVGLSPVAVLVVETDGSIQEEDVLKAAYPGAPATGLHVMRHSFDDALLRPSVAARQIGALALCERVPFLPGAPGVRRGALCAPVPAGYGFRQPVGVQSRSLPADHPYP